MLEAGTGPGFGYLQQQKTFFKKSFASTRTAIQNSPIIIATNHGSGVRLESKYAYTNEQN